MLGWKGPKEARECIRQTRESYLEVHPDKKDLEARLDKRGG